MSVSDPESSTRANRFEALIVPHDLTTVSDRALPVARELGRRGQIVIRLVTTTSPGLDPDQDRAELAARARLLQGWPARLDVLASNEPAAALGEFAEGHQPALICLASHGRTAVTELVLGSMADELLQRHVGPMLIVGPRVHEDVELGAGLVVCVDEFAAGTQLTDVAAAWQATFDGSLDVLEIVAQGSPTTPVLPTGEVRAVAARLPGATTTLVVAHDPARAIVDAATTSGNIVALASHARSGLQRALHGSVTWEVVRFSPTPVLVIPAG